MMKTLTDQQIIERAEELAKMAVPIPHPHKVPFSRKELFTPQEHRENVRASGWRRHYYASTLEALKVDRESLEVLTLLRERYSELDHQWNQVDDHIILLKTRLGIVEQNKPT